MLSVVAYKCAVCSLVSLYLCIYTKVCQELWECYNWV